MAYLVSVTAAINARLVNIGTYVTDVNRLTASPESKIQEVSLMEAPFGRKHCMFGTSLFIMKIFIII